MKDLMFAIMMSVGATALAQAALPAVPERGPVEPEKRAAVLSQALFKACDANQDGRFDVQEAAAAKAAALKKYDANGNGRLDEEELRTMMQDARLQGLRPAGAGNADRHNAELLKFDANGDGKLDEAERAKMKETLQKANRTAADKRRAEQLKAYDVNGDGKLDEAERAKMNQEMQKTIPRPPAKPAPAPR
jgi:Ca2+-binding EF-hand superfamily protein